MEPIGTYLRIVPYDVFKSRKAAIVHIGTSAAHLSKAGDAKFPEVRMLTLDMPCALGVVSGRIVIVFAEQTVGTGRQSVQSSVSAGVDLARPYEERNADVTELAAREARPEMTEIAVALTYEQLETTLRRERIL